jgi:hypothetical protein
MDLAEAVAVLVPGILSARVTDRLMLITPFGELAVDGVLVGVDQRLRLDDRAQDGFDGLALHIGEHENGDIPRPLVKSKQTLFNWIRWLGTHHPATILTRAGVTGSGYLQEDEGFEKEPNLRTYAVIMVDPQNLLIWHADYVDHVDEKTLSGSFEKFLERTCFSILGVTKDKWKPSTGALKKVFHKIWIGYCLNWTPLSRPQSMVIKVKDLDFSTPLDRLEILRVVQIQT